MITATQVAETLRLLVPGFVALWIFYVVGLPTKRTDSQWVIWSVLVSAPIAAAIDLLKPPNDSVRLAEAMGLAIVVGFTLSLIWRLVSAQWPTLKGRAAIRAWDVVMPVPQWAQIWTLDGRVIMGVPNQVSSSVETDDLDIYLKRPHTVDAAGTRARMKGTHGILIPRSQIAYVALFREPPGKAQPEQHRNRERAQAGSTSLMANGESRDREPDVDRDGDDDRTVREILLDGERRARQRATLREQLVYTAIIGLALLVASDSKQFGPGQPGNTTLLVAMATGATILFALLEATPQIFRGLYYSLLPLYFVMLALAAEVFHSNWVLGGTFILVVLGLLWAMRRYPRVGPAAADVMATARFTTAEIVLGTAIGAIASLLAVVYYSVVLGGQGSSADATATVVAYLISCALGFGLTLLAAEAEIKASATALRTMLRAR